MNSALLLHGFDYEDWEEDNSVTNEILGTINSVGHLQMISCA